MSIKRKLLPFLLVILLITSIFSGILVGAMWFNTSEEQVAESNLILEEQSKRMEEFNVQYQNDMEAFQDFLTDEQREQLTGIVEKMSIAFSDYQFEELKLEYNRIVKEILDAKKAYEEEQARIAAEEQAAAQQAVANNSYSSYAYSPYTGDAKEWIAYKESRGNYDAQNGQYWGRYQLSSGWFSGYDKDYILNTEEGHAIQEQKIEEYVGGRYGSWDNAYNFWQSHGWY